MAMAIPLLAGCTAAADGPPPPPATTSAEPTVEPSTTEPEPKPEPEPTPTGLVRPDAMDQNTDEGAIAAAEYFARLADSAVRTSDTAAWTAVSDPQCTFCSSLTERVQELVESGSTLSGGEMTLRGSGRIVGRDETLGVVAVDVPIHIGEQTQHDSAGAAQGSWPESEEYLYFELAYGIDGWVIMTAHAHAVEY